MRAAAEAVAGDLIRAVRAGELRRAGRQGDRQRDVLSVLAFDKRTVGGMSLVLRPGGGPRKREMWGEREIGEGEKWGTGRRRGVFSSGQKIGLENAKPSNSS